jgi:hypothetical protein
MNILKSTALVAVLLPLFQSIRLDAQTPEDTAAVLAVVAAIDSTSDSKSALLSVATPGGENSPTISLRCMHMARLALIDPPAAQTGEQKRAWVSNARRFASLYTIGETKRNGNRAIVTVYVRQPLTIAGEAMVGVTTFEYSLQSAGGGQWRVTDRRMVYSLTGADKQ